MNLGNLFTRTSLRYVLMGGMGVSLLLAADAPKAKKPVRKQADSTAAVAPASSGMTITKDPLTGRLEGGALQPQQPALGRFSVGVPQEIRLPNGMTLVRTGPEFMNASVVTRNSDGTLNFQCVDNLKTADAVVANSAQKVASKENSDAKH